VASYNVIHLAYVAWLLYSTFAVAWEVTGSIDAAGAATTQRACSTDSQSNLVCFEFHSNTRGAIEFYATYELSDTTIENLSSILAPMLKVDDFPVHHVNEALLIESQLGFVVVPREFRDRSVRWRLQVSNKNSDADVWKNEKGAFFQLTSGKQVKFWVMLNGGGYLESEIALDGLKENLTAISPLRTRVP